MPTITQQNNEPTRVHVSKTRAASIENQGSYPLETLNQSYGVDHTAPYAVEVNKGVIEDCARVRGYVALTKD